MSASVSIDLTETIVFASLRGWLLTRIPSSVVIIKGQVNRVPEPAGSDFIVMWPLSRTRLETNIDDYFSDDDSPSPDVKMALQPTQLDVQLDAHGPNGSDYIQIISTLFRDEDAAAYFDLGPNNMNALYASDPRQMPFNNAEAQWEDRWTIDLSLQINPVVTLPQAFCKEVEPTLISVQVVFP